MIVQGAPNLLRIYLRKNPTNVMASFLEKLLLPPILIHNPQLGECTYFKMMMERSYEVYPPYIKNLHHQDSVHGNFISSAYVAHSLTIITMFYPFKIVFEQSRPIKT